MSRHDDLELQLLVEKFKLQDVVGVLHEWGVVCVDDLREMDSKDIDHPESNSPLAPLNSVVKKRLHQLINHLATAEPGITMQVLYCLITELENTL